jgi:predicted cytidylate kinase
MIICISGLTGSGKTTIGEMLAKELGMKHVKPTFKTVGGDGRQLVSFLRRLNPSEDRKFDRAVAAEARKGNSVVSTWLGPWMIRESSLNVWLDASLETRSRRNARSRGWTLKESTEYVEAKDKVTRAHIKSVYGIDIFKDHGVFDVQINTERFSKEDIVALIATLSLERGSKKFR